MKKLLAASALLLSIGSVHAADSIRWYKASASYQSANIDGDSFTGFGLEGSTLLTENVFATGSYVSTSHDGGAYGMSLEFERDKLLLGVGYRYALSDRTDAYGSISYLNMDAKISDSRNSLSASESGFGLKVGVLSLITENIELGGSLSYAQIDVDYSGDTETTIDLSATYHFTDQFSAGLTLGRQGDANTLGVAAIMHF